MLAGEESWKPWRFSHTTEPWTVDPLIIDRKRSMKTGTKIPKNDDVSSVSLLVHWLPKDKWFSPTETHSTGWIWKTHFRWTQTGNWYRAHQADLAQWLPKRAESWLLHWCVTTSRVANLAEVMIYFHKSQPSVAVTPLKMPQITANRQESFIRSHSSSILSQHGLEICEKSKGWALSNSAKEQAEIIILNFQ